jgi:DnaK suppressor protein
MTEQNKAAYRPSAQEPYMGPAQLAWFRSRLEAMRHEILEETRRTLSLLRVGAADRTGDEADRARHETECSLSFLAQERHGRLLESIDRALERIERGTFGYCGETGEEIGLSRLQANPLAVLTVDAQARLERTARLRAAS